MDKEILCIMIIILVLLIFYLHNSLNYSSNASCSSKQENMTSEGAKTQLDANNSGYYSQWKWNDWKPASYDNIYPWNNSNRYYPRNYYRYFYYPPYSYLTDYYYPITY